jgi:hypothetical protein
MVMVSCALLVYLTGVLLARVVLWAYLLKHLSRTPGLQESVQRRPW